jgi:hypothetical protein
MLCTALRSRRPPTFTSRLLSNRTPVRLSDRLVGLCLQHEIYSSQESFHETSYDRLDDTASATTAGEPRLGPIQSLLDWIVAMP